MRKSLLLLLGLFLCTPDANGEEKRLSFANDVMPVFFKAGCNQGTCHGSARGKDGFALSLFGFDKRGDYFRLTQELIGRRVNMAVPAESLLLLKATGAVPHTGGQRFKKESQYYQTLKTWIEQGALNDQGEVPVPLQITLNPPNIKFAGNDKERQLSVTARYSDGSNRDVTKLALFFSNNDDTASIDKNGLVTSHAKGDTYVFARFDRFTIGSEVIVLPEKTDYQWSGLKPANYIDERVFERLKQLQLNPSAIADDSEFVRRLYIDLAGAPPSVQQYKRFIADTRPNKRALLVDELLKHEDFTDLWTGLWAESVRLMGGGYTPVATDVKAAESYYQWIHSQIKQNRPFDEFVREQVAASGSNLNRGPTNLYTMLVHAPRFKPKEFAADFSQLFLGVQIQCAECHNHPFDRWTMDDYYGFVSFFTGMKRKPGVEPREQRIYYDISAAPARHLVDQRPMPAKFLGAVNPVEHDGDPRRALAQWLTAPDNDMFSRNLANRIWAHLLGRGVIEPVDDIRVSNPPANAPLLNALSKHLVESGFSLRSLVRDICNSRVYQLSSHSNQSNRLDTRQFSHARLRRLRADVLMDSVVAVTEVPRGFSGFPEGTRAIDVYPRQSGDTAGAHYGDVFFETFGRSGRASVCACETRSEPTLSQTLHLSVGNTVDPRLSSNRIKELIESGASPEKVIDGLFILTLSRKPTSQETAELSKLVTDEPKDLSVYQDIFWALLNSTEFAFNR